MRVRHLATEPKVLKTDTGWSNGDLPPRHAPVYVKTRPMAAGWEWRSGKATSLRATYTILAIVSVRRDKWSAWLIEHQADGASVVARFEHHGDHPGLHIHAHCARGGIEVGPTSIDNLPSIPQKGHRHRRVGAWTQHTFWEAAKRFFRIKDPAGPLL